MPERLIEIKNLSYSYPDGVEALSAIDLDVFDGEAVGIIGPNGSGKTTLLMHLNGILKGKGILKVCGFEAEEKNLEQIRARVGLVFQDPDAQLFMPTVFEDVAFGPLNMGMKADKLSQAVHEALTEVDMLKNKDRLAHHLSFGEKKRVSLATVLSMNPEILALDEPSSNLDPKHRRELINLLKGFRHTMVIATHDLEMVLEVCSRVVLLDAGRVFCQGKPQEILKDEALLKDHSLEVPYSLHPPKKP